MESVWRAFQKYLQLNKFSEKLCERRATSFFPAQIPIQWLLRPVPEHYGLFISPLSRIDFFARCSASYALVFCVFCFACCLGCFACGQQQRALMITLPCVRGLNCQPVALLSFSPPPMSCFREHCSLEKLHASVDESTEVFWPVFEGFTDFYVYFGCNSQLVVILGPFPTQCLGLVAILMMHSGWS